MSYNISEYVEGTEYFHWLARMNLLTALLFSFSLLFPLLFFASKYPILFTYWNILFQYINTHFLLFSYEVINLWFFIVINLFVFNFKQLVFLRNQRCQFENREEIKYLWKVSSWEQSANSDSSTVCTIQQSRIKNYRIGHRINKRNLCKRT